MVNIMHLTRSVPRESDHTIEVDSSSSEDLDGVEVDIADLVKGKRFMDSTTRFGPSLVSKNTLSFYEEKEFFPIGAGRALDEGEVVPDPQPGEVVVFRDLFNAGLRFPCHNKISQILGRYGVKLHQLTPNAIIQLFNFFLARSFFRG